MGFEGSHERGWYQPMRELKGKLGWGYKGDNSQCSSTLIRTTKETSRELQTIIKCITFLKTLVVFTVRTST